MALFPHSVKRTTDQIVSGGREVTVTRFLPRTDRKLPAIIALHGSGGVHSNAFEEPATLLASSGYAVFVLHYFERTDTSWADEATIRRNFVSWMQTVADCISYLEQQGTVDAGRIALVGFSLGAYLALAVASQDNRVRAVVDYFGGIPQELEAHVAAVPPVLILHGESDRIVPVSEAHRLERLLRDAGRPYEIKLFAGAGHGFSGLTLIDAARRTLAFLNRWVAQPAQPKSA